MISNYDMTPKHEDRVLLPSTAEDYNIYDLNSDDSTDDEDAPRKTVPNWVKGTCDYYRKIFLTSFFFTSGKLLRSQVVMKSIHPPDATKIFPNAKNRTFDLEKLFNKTERRYVKRTSSEYWKKTPPSLNKKF